MGISHGNNDVYHECNMNHVCLNNRQYPHQILAQVSESDTMLNCVRYDGMSGFSENVLKPAFSDCHVYIGLDLCPIQYQYHCHVNCHLLNVIPGNRLDIGVT